MATLKQKIDGNSRHGWAGWLTPDGKFFPAAESSLEYLRQRIDPGLPGLDLPLHELLALEYLDKHRPDLLARLEALRRSEGFTCFEEMDGMITPFMEQHGFKSIGPREWHPSCPPGPFVR